MMPIIHPSILSSINEWKKLKPCRGPSVTVQSLKCDLNAHWGTTASSSQHPAVICPKVFLPWRAFWQMYDWENTKEEDIILSGGECGGGARVSGSDAVTAARDWDYKPWITHASRQKHKSTLGFCPGPAFTQLVRKHPVCRGSTYRFISLSWWQLGLQLSDKSMASGDFF